MYNLEDVFKLSGLPTVTFVKPVRYNEILIALRTVGRGVVIEGPSGIGKTMCVMHILDELGLRKKYQYLTPRIPEDLEIIEDICSWDRNSIGIVIIDDFHLVPLSTQKKIGNLMKVLADEENNKTKIILIGINSTGNSLVSDIGDLLTRISIFPMESNPKEKLAELIQKGEIALNITISEKQKIIEESCGSFFLCQNVCHTLCAYANVLSTMDKITSVDVSYKVIASIICENLERNYESKTIAFAQGNRVRKGTRPYYIILRWFSENNEMSINLLSEAKRRTVYASGLKQVIDKDYIVNLFKKHPTLSTLFYYNSATKELCIEDPKYLFYIKNIDWFSFQTRAGFDEFDDEHSYDIAISFAGAQRKIASKFCELLSECLTVFYDDDHEHEILGANVDEILKPIYEVDSKYVLALFSNEYPYKFWPRVEYDAYKNRLLNKEVFPVYIGESPSDPTSTALGFELIGNDVLKDNDKLNERIEEICEVIFKRFE